MGKEHSFYFAVMMTAGRGIRPLSGSTASLAGIAFYSRKMNNLDCRISVDPMMDWTDNRSSAFRVNGLRVTQMERSQSVAPVSLRGPSCLLRG